MALPILDVEEDFTGYHKIAANEFKADKIERYSARFVKKYLLDILGPFSVEDIENNNNKTKWAKIFDGCYYRDYENITHYFEGLKDALKGFVYFEFTRDNYENRQTGKVKSSASLSEKLPGVEVSTTAKMRYNDAVRNVNGLGLLLESLETVHGDLITYTDNLDGTSTAVLSTVEFLDEGDLIGVSEDEDAEKLQVLTVDRENKTIMLDGVLPVGVYSLSWEPFKNVCFKEMGFCQL